MKILQVIPYFNPKKGGDVAVVYQLSKHLAQRGHEVTIITSDYEFDEIYASLLKNVNVIPFECLINFNMFLFTPSMEKWLKKELKGFDIIHLHNFRCYQHIIINKYAKKYSIPYIFQAHGSVLPSFQKQRLKKIFDIFFGYNILKNASKVIALSKTEAEQYQKMNVNTEKIEIVPNGIDLSEYENLPKRGEFRNQYSIKDHEKIILYVGRLHKNKGLDLLINMFSGVVKEESDVRLVLIGPDDGYKSVLEELIKNLKINDKVIFTGFITSNEKMAAFVDADIFITPSYSGFPVTFLEACVCGTPIITTNNGDHLDWIQNRIGYVVRYDTIQLTNVIFKILRDGDLRKRFGEEGKMVVREKFSWDKVVRNIERTYEKAKEVI